MPQYLAPGVYVEEIQGPETIQSVGTNTAGFIGPTRFGPTSGRPELLTSFLDFQRIYGDWVDLEFSGGNDNPNFVALGVKGFFDEGGTSCYVCRTFGFSPQTTSDDPWPNYATGPVVPSSSPSTPPLTLRARFPGAMGRMLVTLTLLAGRNALVTVGGQPTLTRVHQYDLVYVVDAGSTPASGLYSVGYDNSTGTWTLNRNGTSLALADAANVYPLTVAVDVQFPTLLQGLPALGPSQNVGVFGFDPRAVGTGVTTVLSANPPTRTQALSVPVAMEGVGSLQSSSASADDLPGVIAEALFGLDIIATAPNALTPTANRQVQVLLSGGDDGNVPDATTYEGDPEFNDYQVTGDPDDNVPGSPAQQPFNGLVAFAALNDISIVVAPGASTGWSSPANEDLAFEINDAVITHCEQLLYRVAAIDTPPQLQPNDAVDYRNQRSSNYAALYYPWITIASPIDGSPLSVPPAAYMAGIWARSDTNYGVIKAPANEVVRSAIDFEIRINKAQQELLNPDGVNCLRYFPGAGFLVWGARTISDDPEWKYLNLRRYFCYLEQSIDQGTQWVVFQINNQPLWDSVRHTVTDFLLDEWRSGALVGTTPAQAFFVKCDASTMTADDLANGRLICLIGVAAATPAEFVIFRIGQLTASATS